MIKVKKNNDVKTITKGVYENLYKHLGYTIVKPETEETVKTVTKVTEKKKEENEGIQTETKPSKTAVKSKGDDLE